MRVLLTAAGGLGHSTPLLPLAQALVARGHDVRFATSADLTPGIRRLGIPTADAGMSQPDRSRTFFAEWGSLLQGVPARDVADILFPRIFGSVAMAPMLADLRRIVADDKPDLIVHDAAELAAALVAAESGIARVAHSFGSTVPPHRLDSAGEVTAALWQAAGIEQPPKAGLFSAAYIDIRPPSLPGHPPPSTHVIRERPTPADSVGGDLPPLVTAADDRPLVYVTLGTVFSDVALLRTVIAALASLPVRVLATVGPQGDPAAVGPVPDNAAVERYVPQSELLSHCAVVVSHAGSGTFLGALAHGVPQLCLPQSADQFLNADSGAEAGAAITLEGDAATSDAVRSAVARLRDEASYRSAAERLAAEIASMPTADDAAADLESLIS